ncbi:MAG: hypothetical protein ACLR2O_12525 [Coprococcus sp.]
MDRQMSSSRDQTQAARLYRQPRLSSIHIGCPSPGEYCVIIAGMQLKDAILPA